MNLPLPDKLKPGHLEPSGDCGRTEPLGIEFLHLSRINGRLPPPVHALSLGFRDALKLAFAAQVGLCAM